MIGNADVSSRIFQGGMGVGISLEPLASAVAREGGLGVVSSAGLDRIVSKRVGRKLPTREATAEEIAQAITNSKGKGGIGINIMRAITRDFEDSVLGALDGGVHCVISGAGLPLELPRLVGSRAAIIPIVSSLRVLQVLCKRWKRVPDAVIVEGPKAGGHLGFDISEIGDEKFSLERIFPPIKDFALKNGNFPVIVAGGIYTYEQRHMFIEMGADGTQHGTSFLATDESSAKESFKQAVIACSRKDIVIVDGNINPPGSPCKMAFRALRNSPALLNRGREPKCRKGYVLQRDNAGAYLPCPAVLEPEKYFCICEGLFASSGWQEGAELWTVGVGAGDRRFNRILSVKQVMDMLKGKACA